MNKYLYSALLSIIVPCASRAMSESAIVARFPWPLARVGVSHDGNKFATTHDEEWSPTECALTLTVWQRSAVGRAYQGLMSRRVSMGIGKGLDIWWTDDNQKIALVTMTRGYDYTTGSYGDINYTLFNAENLSDAGSLGRNFSKTELDLCFITYAKGYHSFNQYSTDEYKISTPGDGWLMFSRHQVVETIGQNLALDFEKMVIE